MDGLSDVDALPQMLRPVRLDVDRAARGGQRGRGSGLAEGHWRTRLLAAACLVAGVGLSMWAYQLAQRFSGTEGLAPRVASASRYADTGVQFSQTVPVRFGEEGPVVHSPEVPVARILSAAERFVAERDVLAARAMLEDLVAREQPNGLLAMAETFDPNVLRRWGVTDVAPNVARARVLYQAALRLGVEEASVRLKMLEGH
jgi:hypothetical protein